MHDQELLTALKTFNRNLLRFSQALDRLNRVKHIKVTYVPSEHKANYGYTHGGIENHGWRRLFSRYAKPPRYGKQFLEEV